MLVGPRNLDPEDSSPSFFLGALGKQCKSNLILAFQLKSYKTE